MITFPFRRRSVCALLLLLVGAACLSIRAARAESAAPEPIRRETLHFPSGGQDIQIDLYEPRATNPQTPNILVLHGAGGVVFDGPRMRRVAERLAAGGNRAYLVHYFDRSGTWFITRDSIMYANFDHWLETVRAAVEFVQHQQPGGNAKRPAPVGIYGYSLGAFLALATGSNNPRVAAVAEQAGGMWKNVKSRVERMPPVLVVHGRKDTRVPFDKYAVPLLKRLRERGAKVETSFYPNENHVFREPAQRQVREQVAAFFARHLVFR